jgi:hypothetical protein
VSFAADVPEKLAAFMADSQVPAGVGALGGAVTEPAWRGKPSWYLVATDDHMLPPAAQRAMAERAKEAQSPEVPVRNRHQHPHPAIIQAAPHQHNSATNGRSRQAVTPVWVHRSVPASRLALACGEMRRRPLL